MIQNFLSFVEIIEQVWTKQIVNKVIEYWILILNNGKYKNQPWFMNKMLQIIMINEETNIYWYVIMYSIYYTVLVYDGIWFDGGAIWMYNLHITSDRSHPRALVVHRVHGGAVSSCKRDHRYEITNVDCNHSLTLPIRWRWSIHDVWLHVNRWQYRRFASTDIIISCLFIRWCGFEETSWRNGAVKLSYWWYSSMVGGLYRLTGWRLWNFTSWFYIETLWF